MQHLAFFRSILLILVILAGCATPQEVAIITETPGTAAEETPAAVPAPSPQEVDDFSLFGEGIRPGRFDQGKMWTFENPPVDYFEETYGFRPDTSWFNRARLGALRFSTYCSASFVSPHGLVMTNHHCGRESVTEVSKSGEDLVENGFYATSLADERKVKDLYVDQLLAMADVSERIHAAMQAVRGDDDKAQRKRERIEQLEEEMTNAAKGRDSTLYVQVVELYHGGKYSAYTFKRYDDVRLVMAPEKQLGYFGGDPDNFTFPRYTLDMTFFRAYDKAGKPVSSPDFFPWSLEGSRAGDAVFVVGNPGSTSRLLTTSQILFERDVTAPKELEGMHRRAAILKTYLDAAPDTADVGELRNTYFQITNSIKASTGQLNGLMDDQLMKQRAAGEYQFRRDLSASDSLRALYGSLFQDLEELQLTKKSVAEQQLAFLFFGSDLGSRVLTRALYGYYYSVLKQRNVLTPEELADIKKEALQVKSLPADVEQDLIALRLREVRDALGASDPTVRHLLQDASPDSVALRVLTTTALSDSTGFDSLLTAGYLSSSDATLPLIQALAPLYFQVIGQQQGFDSREASLQTRLAQARFALYGTTMPPDASFSLRITDGLVKGYAYNGTVAPAYTTFYGLYDHYYSYKNQEDWKLPERWLTPPATFSMGTPLNLVTTNDITGGNSGSPLLSQDLKVVGLVFDGNIESLPNHYLYSDKTARTVAVDVRGILEALDEIYDADRVVLELTRGQLSETEEQADNARGTKQP